MNEPKNYKPNEWNKNALRLLRRLGVVFALLAHIAQYESRQESASLVVLHFFLLATLFLERIHLMCPALLFEQLNPQRLRLRDRRDGLALQVLHDRDSRMH